MRARAPQPVDEVLALALRRLGPDDRADALAEVEAITARPPELTRAPKADRCPRPSLALVPGGVG